MGATGPSPSYNAPRDGLCMKLQLAGIFPSEMAGDRVLLAGRPTTSGSMMSLIGAEPAHLRE